VYYAEQGIPIYSLLSSIDLYDYEAVADPGIFAGGG
jgi:hypothetical protein